MSRMPGLTAESAVYASTRHYRSTFVFEAVGQIRIAGHLTPQDHQCSSAAVDQCLSDAEDTLQSELDGCEEFPITRRGPCAAAATARYQAAIAKCDECPAGTRCDSNVCCPNDRVSCAPPCAFR